MMQVTLFLSAILLGVAVEAQKVCGLPKAVTVLRTQDEVAALSGCTAISGSLALNGSAITDLQSLKSLQRVESSLEVVATGLRTLDGLGSLVSLGEFLRIHGNPVLESLAGLEALVNVSSGGVDIHENPQLASLSGLSGLTVRFLFCQPNKGACCRCTVDLILP
jgi:hypothetical protein